MPTRLQIDNETKLIVTANFLLSLLSADSEQLSETPSDAPSFFNRRRGGYSRKN